MVGVIFLLPSSIKIDQILINYLLEKKNFTFVQLPSLSPKELRDIAFDQEKHIQVKDDIVKTTLETFKAIKTDWNNNYIIYPVYFKEQLDISFNRTFYLPFKIDLPVKVRYAEIAGELTLEDYLAVDEFVDPFDRDKLQTTRRIRYPENKCA
jgi:hypothetical protein